MKHPLLCRRPSPTVSRLALVSALTSVALSCAAPITESPRFPTTRVSPAPHLELVWRSELVDQGFWGWEPLEFSQPVVVDDTVLVGTSSGDLVAVSLSTGRGLWKARTGARIDATATVTEHGLVVVGNDLGVMSAIEPGGNIVWTFDTSGEIDGRATVAGATVFFQNSEEILYAVDLETGAERWEYQRDVPDYFTLKGAPQPQVHEGIVYAGFADGFLVALDAATGSVVWGRDLGGGDTKFTDVDSLPVYDGGLIYVASYSGGVYALDAHDGSVVWRNELSGASETLIDGDHLYVTTASRRVACLDKASGRLIWKVRHLESTPTKPILFGDYLMYGGSEFGMYIVDRHNGYPLLHFDPRGGFSAPITQTGDTALMWSNRGYLYRFRVGTL